MAGRVSARRSAAPAAVVEQTASVADTTAEGRGVVRGNSKTVFVDGAMAGETVRYRVRKRRRQYEEAELLEVLVASPDRIEPLCEVYGVCGGCALQHMSAGAQLALKQQVLIDNLQRIGGVRAEEMLPPLTSKGWGYRRKARLAVKHVARKGRVLVGFRERHAPYVTDMQRCETLHSSAGARLGELAELISGLSISARLPQIEIAAGDNATALVFRVLDPPSDADLEAFRQFHHQTGLWIYLQPGGPSTVVPLPGLPAPPVLEYLLPEFDVRIQFEPGDFIQVNGELNQAMVSQAMQLLQVEPDSSVLDLFSGLGNFTLPLARRAASVLGVEGAGEMVERGGRNAARNGLENASFMAADLFEDQALASLAGRHFDRVLLDPPRAGAEQVLAPVAATGAQRVVYVSCHPGTLARDAGHLVTDLGYRLAAAGIMDMFPQTSHVESIALFERR